MAIQIPNPGTGNGATGDNEYVLWTKVKDNFSNTSHAASRLVGTGNGQIPLSGSVAEAFGKVSSAANFTPEADADLVEVGVRTTLRTDEGTEKLPEDLVGRFLSIDSRYVYSSTTSVQTGINPQNGDVYRRINTAGSFAEWKKSYSTGNTTLDGNGALKPSSPVLRVFSDCITGNHDGDAMAATYTKNGVGDYTITGTTGLRTDGWYVVIPNDMNGNPKVAITLDDTDGVITLRSYVRIFDMSTFKFVPDLEQPLDIPDGRWIDLRFNDLPIDESEISEV